MACTPFSVPTSQAPNSNGMRRCESSKELQNRANIQRSLSDNNLVCCINRNCGRLASPRLRSSRSMGVFPFIFSTNSELPNSLLSFHFDPAISRDMSIVEKGTPHVVDLDEDSDYSKDIAGGEDIKKRANWVERLMEIRSRWRNRQQQQQQPKKDCDWDEVEVSDEQEIGDCERGGCEVTYSSEEDDDEEEGGGKKSLDRESFSRFLIGVPWSDIKLFSKLAFLCNIAYVIQDIRPKDLKRHFGLRFVTSSLVKKAEAAAIKAQLDQDFTHIPKASKEDVKSNSDKDFEQVPRRASVAYEIAASAASYVQSRATNKFPSSWHEGFWESEEGVEDVEGESSSPHVYKSEVAACVAASTMTSVVAAGEKEKSEAAKDLQSLHSSPCEWFVCDDPNTYTRCFVIQGSDSLASWQANLFFEPTNFEETDCLVHRGIYEAAKGIYTQFVPEIIEHLNKYGERAKLQFTGHSLGGSLSLLVHLMLLAKKVVKPSALRPVVTFGSPFVFCGGHKILEGLGMDESQIHCVMMHRDIVPRAFSCNYPNHVANVLKRLNGTFRSHPCLIKNKFLYSPMGKIFILQPDESSSPPHPLLPQGCALYALDNAQHEFSSSVLRTFLNSPHPLETLSDPTAYGSEGTILRDHDSSNYLKAVNGVLRQHYSKPVIERTMMKERNALWPLLASPSPHTWSNDGIIPESIRLKEEIMTGV